MARITLNISEELRRSIEDFIEKHPEYNKSSLVRTAVRWYMDKKHMELRKISV